MCFVIAALENQQEVETRGAGKELYNKSDRSLGWPGGQAKAGARSGKGRKHLSKGEVTSWMGRNRDSQVCRALLGGGRVQKKQSSWTVHSGWGEGTLCDSDRGRVSQRAVGSPQKTGRESVGS